MLDNRYDQPMQCYLPTFKSYVGFIWALKNVRSIFLTGKDGNRK